jgi:hypothetical protein
MPLEMDPEVRARWTAALRSETYLQGRGNLREFDTFCCLGVLCDLAVSDGVVAMEVDENGCWSYEGRGDYLPLPVKEWAGIPGDGEDPQVAVDMGEGVEGVGLASLNDDYRWTFAQIADAIDGGAA